MLLILLLGLFMLGMIHVERMRHLFVQAGVRCAQFIRVLVHEVLLEFLPVETLNRAVESWPFQLFYWYLFKPVLACALLWLLVPATFTTQTGAETQINWVSVASMLLAAGIVLNSRFGQAVAEALVQAAAEFYVLLRAGLLPGLLRWIVSAFKEVTEMLEYVLFTVDEWLRFRSGDSRLSLVVRTVLGLLWFPISYVARFYMVVLIEPGLNPIKFPVSSVAAKFFYTALLTSGLMSWSAEHLGVFLNVILGGTVWLLPDAFGFLFWETKENWSLYRANRRSKLVAEVIGGHGETLPRLLQPGFHSGTIPRLFSRLREAEREAAESNDWRAVRRYRHEIQEVEKSVQLFVERDMVALLHESTSWRGQPLNVGEVELATNRIDVELLHGDDAEHSVWLTFEDRAGWIIAHIRERGWLEALSEDQRQSFAAALASLYKLSGVDLVLEQIESNVPPAAAGIDITADHLVVWVDHRQGRSLLYSLAEKQERLEPRTATGEPSKDGPVLDAARLIFARLPLYWNDWLEYWRQDQGGNGRPRLFSGGIELSLLGTPQSHHGAESAATASADGHEQNTDTVQPSGALETSEARE